MNQDCKFAQCFPFAAQGLEPLAGQLEADIGFVDDGGGHESIHDLGCSIFDLASGRIIELEDFDLRQGGLAYDALDAAIKHGGVDGGLIDLLLTPGPVFLQRTLLGLEVFAQRLERCATP